MDIPLAKKMISNEVRQSLQTVCLALNKNKVDYLIVGGTAVAFHGYQSCQLKSVKVTLDENDLHVISKQDLLINKSAVSRDIDKKDLDSLR
ncbi:MAG: hypothetical protein ACKO96_46800 [Flammeovirgaceae bacterium]